MYVYLSHILWFVWIWMVVMGILIMTAVWEYLQRIDGRQFGDLY